MYVSIDMDNLRFLHKHHDHETVSALSWLECGQQVSILIAGLDGDEFIRPVAHGDLCHLYKNVTGDDYREGQWGERADQFRERLREAARNMPTTTAVTAEVLAQVEAVDDRLHNGERFSYALGSTVPAQQAELFPLLPVAPMAPPQFVTADLRAERIRTARQEREEALRTATPDTPKAEDQADTPTPAPVKKPKRTSVQPVVFAAAEKAWLAAGGDKAATSISGPTWDAVRKQVAEELEAQGYHPTTIRIKLAKWAKERG